jgi:hypothetical protein
MAFQTASPSPVGRRRSHNLTACGTAVEEEREGGPGWVHQFAKQRARYSGPFALLLGGGALARYVREASIGSLSEAGLKLRCSGQSGARLALDDI